MKAAAAAHETPFTLHFKLTAAVDMVALKLWDRDGRQLVQVGWSAQPRSVWAGVLASTLDRL